MFYLEEVRIANVKPSGNTYDWMVRIERVVSRVVSGCLEEIKDETHRCTGSIITTKK